MDPRAAGEALVRGLSRRGVELGPAPQKVVIGRPGVRRAQTENPLALPSLRFLLERQRWFVRLTGRTQSESPTDSPTASPPPSPPLPPPQDTVEACLRGALLTPQGASLGSTLVFCIMPERSDEYYDLKYLCNMQIGIASQCMLEKHFLPPPGPPRGGGGGGRGGGGGPGGFPSDQYIANIALKIRLIRPADSIADESKASFLACHKARMPDSEEP